MLISRVADPRNFLLVGLPPKDMLEDVAAAWIANGLNVDDCFKRALSVTGEWVYDPSQGPLKTRIRQRRMSEFTIPLKNRTLAEVLEPQPAASVVIKKLLAWMDRVDTSSRGCRSLSSKQPMGNRYSQRMMTHGVGIFKNSFAY